MSEAVVAAARSWIERYLGEELEAAEIEAVEREDLLFGQVAIVEKHARDWLKGKLVDPNYPLALRRDVYRSLTGPLRHLVRATFEK